MKPNLAKGLQLHLRKIFLVTSVALALSIFLFSSYSNFISHSEFWSIASGKLFGKLSSEALHVYYKSLFYSVLALPYNLPLSNVDHILFTRMLFGLIGFLNFYLFLTVLKGFSPKTQSTYLYGVLLISFQIYFYNSFRVRADLLAGLLLTLVYFRVTKQFLAEKRLSVFDPITFVFYFFAFLATPKSIYLSLALFSYQSYLGYENTKKLFLSFSYYLLSPIAVALSLSALLFSLNFLTTNPYTLALDYHLNSLRSGSFFNQWHYVTASLKINFFHHLLVIAGTTLIFYSKRLSCKPILKAQLFLSLACWLCLLLHPERWSYFIAQLAPFLLLPALFVFMRFERRHWAALFAALMVATPFVATNHHSWHRSNSNQMQIISQLESLFQQTPQATYFDSTGLLPREASLMWFLGPNDPGARDIALSALKKDPPEFIFFTSKLDLAGADLLVFLYEHYEQVLMDVWIRKDKAQDIDLSSAKEIRSLRSLFIFDFYPYLRF